MREVEVEGAVRAIQIEEGHDQMKAKLEKSHSEMLKQKRYRNVAESSSRKLRKEKVELKMLLAQEKVKVKCLIQELQPLESMEKRALQKQSITFGMQRLPFRLPLRADPRPSLW